MCKLILSAFARLRGPHSVPVPEDFEFAVWIDFSCQDQDRFKVVDRYKLGPIENAKLFGAGFGDIGPVVMQQCDLFLIPLVDPDYLKWSRTMMVVAKNGQDSSINRFKNGQMEAFEQAVWQYYLGRARCRLEMMVAAAYPVNNCEERASLFRGSIETPLSNGLRPFAFLAQDDKSVDFLPTLKPDFFEKYQPEDGKLAFEQDRYRVCEITRRTHEQWTKRVEEEKEEAGACARFFDTQLVSRTHAEEEDKGLA